MYFFCILGADFFRKVRLSKVWGVLDGGVSSQKTNLSCCRVSEETDRNVPANLRELFERDSIGLNEAQKNVFSG